MKLITTLLTATIVCAAMLAAAVHLTGDAPERVPSTGLTAAAILGTDGMVPGDPDRAGARLDRSALARLADEASRTGDGVAPGDGPHG